MYIVNILICLFMLWLLLFRTRKKSFNLHKGCKKRKKIFGNLHFWYYKILFWANWVSKGDQLSTTNGLWYCLIWIRGLKFKTPKKSGTQFGKNLKGGNKAHMGQRAFPKIKRWPCQHIFLLLTEDGTDLSHVAYSVTHSQPPLPSKKKN